MSQQKKTSQLDPVSLYAIVHERVTVWRTAGRADDPAGITIGVNTRAVIGSNSHIRKLVGVPDGDLWKWGPEAMNALRALAGPNGYAVYRILLVKRGMTMED